jgi:hypothetical protein
MSQNSIMEQKPPSRSLKCPPLQKAGEPAEGSFLYSICRSTYADHVTYPKRPVYKYDDYLKLLKTNNKQMGIPYVDPKLPVYEYQPIPEKTPEVELDVPDRVYMRLRILKNGIVRVKLNASIWDLHNAYYRRAIKPPFKAVLQAYKAHGFSQNFMENIKKNNEKQKRLAQRIDKVFINIFDKDNVKRLKKEKEKEKEDEVNIELHEPEEDEEDEEIVDGEMDIEPDADDDEAVEDDFLSDGE